MKRAILLVDHGSRHGPANAILEQIAALVSRRGEPGLVVRHAHMELAEPTLAQALEACVAAGADEVVVHPYFLTPGRHATTDIPRMAAEAAAKHAGVRVVVSPPLGVDELLADVVLRRCAETA